MTLRSTGGKISIGGAPKLTFNKVPIWDTSSGSLGSHHETLTVTSQSYVIGATDPDNFPSSLVYSVFSGSLPSGSSLNSSSGAITGAAVAVGLDTTFNFVARVSDGIDSADRAFSITVEDNIAPSFVTATNLGAFHESLTVTSQSIVIAANDTDSLPDPVAFSFGPTGTPPTGSSIDGSSGAITGAAIPVASDTLFTFDVTATDGLDPTIKSFQLTIENNIAPSFSTGTDLGTLHEAATLTSQGITVAATDADNLPDPVTFSLGPGGTPPTGAIISAGGAITGPAVVVGTTTLFTFDITADDGLDTTIKSFEITVTNNTLPQFTTPGGLLSTMVDGEVYSGTSPLAADDSDGLPLTTTFTTGDALPTGLTLATNGTISGTVTDASITEDTLFTFTATADDGLDTDTRQFCIQVNCNVFESSATTITFVDDVDLIHGLGTGNAGYGQADTTAAPTIGDCVIKTELTTWKSVIADMVTHQGITLSPVIAADSDIASIPFTDAPGFFATLNDDNLQQLETVPLTVAGGQVAVASKLTSARGTSWTTLIEHVFTVTFVDSDAARHFFNTGGQIRIDADRTGGSATTQNANWDTLLGIGVYIFSSTDYFALTTSAVVKRDTIGTGAYSANNWIIRALTDTVGSPRGGKGSVLTFNSRFRDDHTNAFFDSVDGTFTSTISERRCTGVFSQASPTFATTTAMTAGS